MTTTTRNLLLSAVPVAAVLGYLYWDSLGVLFAYWLGSEDYSHGIFVPLISGFLIWRSRHRLLQFPKEQRWWGPAGIVFGLVHYFVGELSTLFVIHHVSLWTVIVGFVVAW